MVFYEYGFNFSRAQTFPGDLDGVIGAAEDIPQAIIIDGRPIPVNPDIGKARPVSLEVAFRVFPKTASHTDPWFPHDQFANLVPNRATLLIHNVGGNPR